MASDGPSARRSALWPSWRRRETARQRAGQHVISRADGRVAAIDRAAFASKNRYTAANYALRQACILQGVRLSYPEMHQRMKGHDAYQALPAQVAQQVLRVLDRPWTAPGPPLDRPRTPPGPPLGRPRTAPEPPLPRPRTPPAYPAPPLRPPRGRLRLASLPRRAPHPPHRLAPVRAV